MYSKETYTIADVLRQSKVLRHQLIEQLQSFDEWITYSNQDFDQKQQLAAWLYKLAQ